MTEYNRLISIQKNVEQYFENRIELAKLEIIRFLSAYISRILAGLLVLIHMVLFIFFFCMSFALIVGEWFGSYALGVMVVAGLLGVLALLFWLNRKKWFQKSVLRACIESFMSKSAGAGEKRSD